MPVPELWAIVLFEITGCADSPQNIPMPQFAVTTLLLIDGEEPYLQNMPPEFSETVLSCIDGELCGDSQAMLPAQDSEEVLELIVFFEMAGELPTQQQIADPDLAELSVMVLLRIVGQLWSAHIMPPA